MKVAARKCRVLRQPPSRKGVSASVQGFATVPLPQRCQRVSAGFCDSAPPVTGAAPAEASAEASQALRDPDATGSSAAPLAEGTAPLPRPRGFAMIAWPRRRGERWNESTHGIWNCFPLEPLPSPLSPPPSPRSPDCCPRPPRYSPAPLPRPGAGEAVDGKLILPSSPDLRASKKSAPGTWWDRAGRGIPMRAQTLRSDSRAGDAPPSLDREGSP